MSDTSVRPVGSSDDQPQGLGSPYDVMLPGTAPSVQDVNEVFFGDNQPYAVLNEQPERFVLRGTGDDARYVDTAIGVLDRAREQVRKRAYATSLAKSVVHRYEYDAENDAYITVSERRSAAAAEKFAEKRHRKAVERGEKQIDDVAALARELAMPSSDVAPDVKLQRPAGIRGRITESAARKKTEAEQALWKATINDVVTTSRFAGVRSKIAEITGITARRERRAAQRQAAHTAVLAANLTAATEPKDHDLNIHVTSVDSRAPEIAHGDIIPVSLPTEVLPVPVAKVETDDDGSVTPVLLVHNGPELVGLPPKSRQLDIVAAKPDAPHFSGVAVTTIERAVRKPKVWPRVLAAGMAFASQLSLLQSDSRSVVPTATVASVAGAPRASTYSGVEQPSGSRVTLQGDHVPDFKAINSAEHVQKTGGVATRTFGEERVNHDASANNPVSVSVEKLIAERADDAIARAEVVGLQRSLDAQADAERLIVASQAAQTEAQKAAKVERVTKLNEVAGTIIGHYELIQTGESDDPDAPKGVYTVKHSILVPNAVRADGGLVDPSDLDGALNYALDYGTAAHTSIWRVPGVDDTPESPNYNSASLEGTHNQTLIADPLAGGKMVEGFRYPEKTRVRDEAAGVKGDIYRRYIGDTVEEFEAVEIRVLPADTDVSHLAKLGRDFHIMYTCKWSPEEQARANAGLPVEGVNNRTVVIFERV